jgi:rhamnogalacturonan endolyase
MTTRLFLSLFCAVWGCQVLHAQPRYDFSRLHTERLDRGVVAIRQDDSHVVISWRTLKTDSKGQAFDIYRDGKKLNTQPLIEGGTFYTDELPQGQTALYEVRGGEVSGTFTLKADAPQGYIPLKLNKPKGGTTPEGWPYSYIANDASVADVDGDGQYEIILKWDPTNSRDNAHDGFTGPTLFDCYRLNGEHLWRINLGRNIRSGAHYVPFIVYDLDGDGKAELAVKTADGTTDGKGNVIGDPDADYREGVAEALAHPIDTTQMQDRRYRRMRGNRPAKEGRILSGPEYITIFNGLTGEAMDTKPYVPERGDLSAWGDERGNRSERYLAAVGYLDGHHASVIFCRGYYTRTVLAAWDWDGHQLKQHWVFDTNNPEWKDYAGQGNHNLRVADVDGDGCDEITYGSMAVDHDGRGLYNTGMGHGDAIHLTAFDPTTDELQVWDCHENKRDGSDFRDARTGKVIFQIPSNEDVGRAMAADIDPTHPGVEMWSSDSHGIRNIKGEVITAGSQADNNTHVMFGGARVSVNFGIWWDGDLLRELLDHETVTKYNWQTHRADVLQHFDGCQFNNGTKSNPCLSADIIGDWREEVITRDRQSEELRIYVTTIPTDHRINCLMQDIPYRLSVATENVGYNQPPETGFYLGNLP